MLSFPRLPDDEIALLQHQAITVVIAMPPRFPTSFSPFLPRLALRPAPATYRCPALAHVLSTSSTPSSSSPTSASQPRILYEAQPISLNLLIASAARLQLGLAYAGGVGCLGLGFFQYQHPIKSGLVALSLVVYGWTFNQLVGRFNSRFVDVMRLVDPSTVEITAFKSRSSGGDFGSTKKPNVLRFSLIPSNEKLAHITRVKNMQDGLLAIETSSDEVFYVVLARGKVVDSFLKDDLLVTEDKDVVN